MVDDSWTQEAIAKRVEEHLHYALLYCEEGNSDKAEDCTATARRYFRRLIERIEPLPAYRKPKGPQRRQR